MKKSIVLVFKSGATVTTPYSYKIYQELIENIGKDHRIEGKNFVTNGKALDGVFFQAEEA